MKIAIIGSGISGLATAYLMHNANHDITVYEKNDYIGGHSRTIDVSADDGNVAVDTGFIVFNYRNYPLLTGLFDYLEVPVVKSDMSFGASINNGWLEYGTQKISNLFAQKKNILDPKFLGMISDILRFNRNSLKLLEEDSLGNISLGDYLDKLKVGGWFRNYYLFAIGASIWSTPMEKIYEFPAKTFIRFFANHGLLTVNDQPQWYTVRGGSREYVKRLTNSFYEKILLSNGVRKVNRHDGYIEVVDNHDNIKKYDHVVFACHSDQALALLDSPSEQESAILANLRYQKNDIVVHSDVSFMPSNKKAWASWVYLSEEKQDNKNAVSLSYWMNNLQPLATNQPIIVTLNPATQPVDNLIYDRYQFEHPLFDQKAIDAQQNIEQIQGNGNIWYVGAYQRYGFHEDGILSAVNLAKKFNITPPWIAH